MRDEVTRRGIHMSGTAIPLSHVLAPSLIPWWFVQVFLVCGLAVALGLEVVRLWIGLDWVIFERLTREYEQENLAGYFLYAVGMTVTGLAFAPRFAIPAMFMLTVADPVSGLLSSDELRSVKEVWVLLATFGVAALLAAPFVPPAGAIAGAVAATVADGVKPVWRGYVLDDNLTIPVVAAAVMYAVVEVAPQVA